LEPDGAVEEIRQQREQRGQGGRADHDVPPDLTERDEHPEKGRGREEKAHAHETRTQEERCPFDEVRWLEEDRIQLPNQVDRREEALLKEEVALREAGVTRVERRSPAEHAVPDIQEREGQPAGDDPDERRAIWRSTPSRGEQRERRRGDCDRQPCQRRDAKKRADQGRCAAPRCDRE